MARLIDELPDILKDFYEYQELLASEDPEFERLDDLLLKWRENRYPKLADEDGIVFFEELLDIVPLPGESLEDRRFRVLTRLNSRLPYTEIQLRKMLAAICGWEGFTLSVSELVVLVSLAEESNAKIHIIYEMLLEVVPMNLLIEIHQLLVSHGVIYTAAATQLGTTLVLLPWQQDELMSEFDIHTAALYRVGTGIVLLPRQEEETESPFDIRLGTAMRLGVTLAILPRSVARLDGRLTITAPGVERIGTRMSIGE